MDGLPDCCSKEKSAAKCLVRQFGIENRWKTIYLRRKCTKRLRLSPTGRRRTPMNYSSELFPKRSCLEWNQSESGKKMYLRLNFHRTAKNHTCPPPNTNDPKRARSLAGIHDDKSELNAGNVVPSPNPIKTRRIIKPCELSFIVVMGVRIENIAVDRMPKLRTCFPPKRSHNHAPGI